MRSGLPVLDSTEQARLLARKVRRGSSAEEEFAGREQELAFYLRRSSGRFATTLALLEQSGASISGEAALEIGADPWLFSQLLLERGIELVSSGRRPGVWREDDKALTPQRIELAWGERRAQLAHHLFDVERDRWPFADASFELVVCMEVLEHLVYSPAHLLYEARRILRPGGTLLLTTPNAVAAAKLGQLLLGRNIHGAYSGYGWHGRHNREFSPAELERVLRAAGFEPEVSALNIRGYEATGALPRTLQRLGGTRLWRGRGDHLFAIGRAAGGPRLDFSDEIYRSFDRTRMRREGVLLVDEVAEPGGSGP